VKAEHADGSFMDHLLFCHDYCAVHFKGHSPRVLLLHSILGVGTNIFPIKTSQMPKLESLINPAEMMHIQAFPSVLRLMYAGLMASLEALPPHELADMKTVHFNRVIDNKAISLSALEFWEHLNFQLIHQVYHANLNLN
jgi:hypothetical protein